jgi:hypothetical protein
MIPTSTEADFDSDIILKGSQVLTISGVETCFNISIEDEATLILKNANLRVNGIIRMSDYARLFIITSRLELSPPAIEDSIHVVHFMDNSMCKATDNSYVIFKPQPTPTNISYMLMDDNSEFFLIDSTFRGDLPSIIDQSIEVASVTAGVYLLSGSASWYMFNSNIIGTVSLDGVELTGRWFWSSLHQRSSIYIDNTDMELLSNSASYTILKPVSGSITVKNSRIFGGKVDVEVAAQAVMESSTFDYMVRFMDSTMSTIKDCTFKKDVSIGTTLAITEEEYNPETSVEISESIFEGRLRCVGNSTTSIFESSFSNLYAGINSTLHITNSSIEEHLSIRDQGYAEVVGCDIESILLDDSSTLDLENSQEISSITFYGNNEYQTKGIIVFDEIRVNTTIFQSNFDNSLTFENAEVSEIRFYNEIKAIFELVNSSVGSITPLRSGENVTLTFIIVNTTTSDLMALSDNITVHIYYRLKVHVKLNDGYIDTEVEARRALESWRQNTQNGIATFDLHYRTKTRYGITTTMNYQVFTSHLALSETKDIVLVTSMTLVFDWIDPFAPIILNLTYNPSDWNLGKDITVSVNAYDMGVESIGATTLFYRKDKGEWGQINMFKTNDNTYEAIIPKQTESGTLSFYIESEDKAGNVARSEVAEVSVGGQENVVFYSGIIALFGVIAVFGAKRMIVRKKIRAYANKYEFHRKKK